MSVEFCVEVLEQALVRYPKPQIFNTNQGSQFTSNVFTKVLKDNEINISVDGKGRATDNVFIERFWRDIKYNCIYLHAFETPPSLYKGIEDYVFKHCYKHKHSSLGYKLRLRRSANSSFDMKFINTSKSCKNKSD